MIVISLNAISVVVGGGVVGEVGAKCGGRNGVGLDSRGENSRCTGMYGGVPEKYTGPAVVMLVTAAVLRKVRVCVDCHQWERNTPIAIVMPVVRPV